MFGVSGKCHLSHGDSESIRVFDVSCVNKEVVCFIEGSLESLGGRLVLDINNIVEKSQNQKGDLT